jgi:hypothetical protein
MREPLTIAHNTCAAVTTEGKLTPSCEIILVYSEPHYGYDEGGNLRRTRKTDSFRFMATPEVLTQLSKQLSQIADEAEDELEKAIAKSPVT